MALGTEAPAALLHRLRPLTSHHAGGGRIPDDVVDAEHSSLPGTEPRRRRRRVIRRGQLLPVGWPDRHVGVDRVGVRGRPGDLDGGENRGLVDVRGVGAEVAALEALPAPQETATLEHVLRVGVQSPVVALPGPPGLSRDLDKTIIESQVVADGVLPFL